MAYESSFSFDSVIVIESLRSGELPTGTDLFETTIAPESLAQNIYAELYRVPSRRELLGALGNVGRLASEGRSPIIHLEMHGNEQGLQLATGETVDWSELAPSLAAVNRTTRMNLLVVAAACHGWHMADVLRPVDRAPAWAILGPPQTAEAGDLYVAMRRFYGSLLPKLTLRDALDAMNDGANMADWTYRLQSADLLYCHVFRHYMESHQHEETVAERVSRLVAEIARAQELDVTQTMRLRAELTSEINNHEFWFERYKTRFLMLDEFPENARRFPLAFDDCAPEAV